MEISVSAFLCAPALSAPQADAEEVSIAVGAEEAVASKKAEEVQIVKDRPRKVALSCSTSLSLSLFASCPCGSADPLGGAADPLGGSADSSEGSADPVGHGPHEPL